MEQHILELYEIISQLCFNSTLSEVPLHSKVSITFDQVIGIYDGILAIGRTYGFDYYIRNFYSRFDLEVRCNPNLPTSSINMKEFDKNNFPKQCKILDKTTKMLYNFLVIRFGEPSTPERRIDSFGDILYGIFRGYNRIGATVLYVNKIFPVGVTQPTDNSCLRVGKTQPKAPQPIQSKPQPFVHSLPPTIIYNNSPINIVNTNTNNTNNTNNTYNNFLINMNNQPTPSTLKYPFSNSFNNSNYDNNNEMNSLYVNNNDNISNFIQNFSHIINFKNDPINETKKSLYSESNYNPYMGRDDIPTNKSVRAEKKYKFLQTMTQSSPVREYDWNMTEIDGYLPKQNETCNNHEIYHIR